jgi:2-haloacid dehalogenase
MAAPSIVVFDVNETLLDIESIAPFFEEKFGDRNVLREWYNQLILYSNAITLTGYYETFFALGLGVLEMLGTIYGVSIKPADLEELRSSMLSMPAHKDVPEGLRLLKEAGFRLVTLPWNTLDSVISSSASSASTVYASLSLLRRFTIS